MPDGLLRLTVGGAILLHGLGHGGAIGALLWIAARPGTETGGWTAARSWALPGLANSSAAVVASAFWLVTMAGFVIAALGFWGVIVPGGWWRPVAVGSAVLSMAGIGLFAGTWPTFNTLAALAMNIAVLAAIFWLDWG